jgi:putative transposase
LDKSYNAFFLRCKKGETPGFPRFKNKDRFCTIDYGNRSDGWQIKKGMLYVQHLGTIRMADFFDAKESHHFSITKRGGKVYANFAYEFEEPIRTFATASIGLDFGLQTFITTSEGEKFDSPKFHKVTLKQEAKLHRRLHRAEKGSKARAKAKRSLQTHKRKEANRRRNFNHQLSRKLVNNYKVIVTEDIKLENLVSDIRNINRTYRDVAWGQFTNFLRYKAENAGRVFIKVNPAFTTQECSACGNLVPKLLTDRWHECSCGHKEDRDINAAKNILRRGLASLASVERLVTKSS